MAPYAQYAIVLLITVSIMNKVSCLRCYSCDPAISPADACGDPFNETLGTLTDDCTGDGIVCVKIVARNPYNMSAVSVGRTCSNEGSQMCNKARDKLKLLGNKLTFCKTCDKDLCNLASGPSIPSFVLVALASFHTFLHIKPFIAFSKF